MEQPEPRVLVVDDDPLIREELQEVLTHESLSVRCATSSSEALERLAAEECAVAVVDVRLAGDDGMALTREIRNRWPQLDVIVISGYGSIRDAVEAMKQGAVDYITKPFEPQQILLATQKALERRRLIDEIQYLRRQLSERYAFANMVSRNPVMLDIFSTIEALADNDVTVLISGESGTGKELVARAIHYQGRRRAGRFVAINCAAVPEPLLESELFGCVRGAFTGAFQDRVGKIELANGGTVFLDEVESIPLSMQAKLLRVLEERAIERLGGNRKLSVDMRIVAATNENLSQHVREGRVREDFYYRINVIPIHLPPLRDRREDIPLLVAEFLRNHALACEKGIDRLSDRAVNQLIGYDWPGNVRELQNVMERAVLRTRGDTIREVDIPAEEDSNGRGGATAHYQLPLREFLRGAERSYLERLLDRYGGGVAGCARHAEVDQATLHRKIKAHGLRASDYRNHGRSVAPVRTTNRREWCVEPFENGKSGASGKSPA
jgi:two-component system, NtrC family, response regulator AtoC